MKKLSRSLIILGSVLVIFVTGLFGTSVLTNLHLKYLRNQGKNTVLIHNVAGSGATGFVVKGKSGKYYIMTNNHVCELEQQGLILGDYQGDNYELKVVKRYVHNDLCAMSAPTTVASAFDVAKSYELGDTAYAIGHPQLEPLSIAIGELSDTVTTHIVVKYNPDPGECTGPTYSIETDLGPFASLFGIFTACVRNLEANSSSIIILPGNSGSAIINIWGNVVGVAFAANEYGTRSYVVPLSYLKDFLNDL